MSNEVNYNDLADALSRGREQPKKNKTRALEKRWGGYQQKKSYFPVIWIIAGIITLILLILLIRKAGFELNLPNPMQNIGRVSKSNPSETIPETSGEALRPRIINAKPAIKFSNIPYAGSKTASSSYSYSPPSIKYQDSSRVTYLKTKCSSQIDALVNSIDEFLKD